MSSTKALPPLFMPAPRPATRLSPRDAQRLIEASADLGFSRPSTEVIKDKPEDQPKTIHPDLGENPGNIETEAAVTQDFITPIKSKQTNGLASRQTVQNRHNQKASEKRAQKAKKNEPEALVFGQTLRLDVPDEVWTALKIESVHRRVTVKYLILEALKKAGYPVNLNLIPEDGRRMR